MKMLTFNKSYLDRFTRGWHSSDSGDELAKTYRGAFDSLKISLWTCRRNKNCWQCNGIFWKVSHPCWNRAQKSVLQRPLITWLTTSTLSRAWLSAFFLIVYWFFWSYAWAGIYNSRPSASFSTTQKRAGIHGQGTFKITPCNSEPSRSSQWTYRNEIYTDNTNTQQHPILNWSPLACKTPASDRSDHLFKTRPQSVIHWKTQWNE